MWLIFHENVPVLHTRFTIFKYRKAFVISCIFLINNIRETNRCPTKRQRGIRHDLFRTKFTFLAILIIIFFKSDDQIIVYHYSMKNDRTSDFQKRHIKLKKYNFK